MEQRQETEQSIASWEEAMEAITRKIDSSVEEMTELIQSMNERWPTATGNGEGVRSGSAESPGNAPITGSLVAVTNDREIAIFNGISNQKLAATEVPSDESRLQPIPTESNGARGSGSGSAGGFEARSGFNRTPKLEYPANLEEGLGTDNVNHPSTHLANLSAKNSQGPSNDSDVSSGIEGAGDPTISWGITISGGQEIKLNIDGNTPRSELQENLEKFQFQYEFPKVISNFPNLGMINVASSENLVVEDVHLANLVNMEVIGKSMTEFGASLLGISENSNAYKAFVKMPSRRMSEELMLNTIEGRSSSHPITFDPGGLILSSFTSLRGIANNCVKGINVTSSLGRSQQEQMPSYSLESIWVIDEGIVKQRLLNRNVIFDPGIAKLGSNSSGSKSWKIAYIPCSWEVSSDSSIQKVKVRIFIFDPGGIQPVQIVEQRLKMMGRSSKSALNHSLLVVNTCCCW